MISLEKIQCMENNGRTQKKKTLQYLWRRVYISEAPQTAWLPELSIRNDEEFEMKECLHKLRNIL
jgi:hypothetical protein